MKYIYINWNISVLWGAADEGIKRTFIGKKKQECAEISSGGTKIQILYLSTNTTLQKYSTTSTSPALKTLLK